MPPKTSPPTLPTLARGSACQTARGGLTDEEVAVAAQVRALREEERALRLALAAASADQRDDVEARLAAVRARGRELMARREEARHRRMVLLGHEPP